MTKAVDWDLKPQTKQKNKTTLVIHLLVERFVDEVYSAGMVALILALTEQKPRD